MCYALLNESVYRLAKVDICHVVEHSGTRPNERYDLGKRYRLIPFYIIYDRFGPFILTDLQG